MRPQGVERLVFVGVTWAVVALAGLPALVAQAPQPVGPKSPTPSEAARKEAQLKLREVYGDEYSAAASPEQKAALATKLAAKAEQTTDNPASQFVLFAAARDLAVQAGQADAAFRAIDKMAERFTIDALAEKVEAVGKLAEHAVSAKQSASLATLSIELLDDLCAADQFDKAQDVVKKARDAAKESKNTDLVKQATIHAKKVETTSEAYEQVKPAFAVLDKKPADPEANLSAGKYVCFVKGDWGRGLSMLALGSDESLSKVARKDLEGATNADNQMALGDAWWKLAEDETGEAKRKLRDRAGHWYQTALAHLSGAAKETVDKRLAEISQAKTSATASKDAARILKGIAGNYLALATLRKTKELKAAAWELRADGSLTEENAAVGSWTVTESQIVVKFNDAIRASAVIRLKKKEPFLGTITFVDGETWTCELHRAVVLARWQHRIANGPSMRLRFWSNGRIDYPGGLALWSQDGLRLTLKWPNGDVDNCSLSRQGQSYSGQNQRGIRVNGTRDER